MMVYFLVMNSKKCKFYDFLMRAYLRAVLIKTYLKK